MLILSLVASVVALAVGCLGLLGFCLWLLKQQRRQAEHVLARTGRQRDHALQREPSIRRTLSEPQR